MTWTGQFRRACAALALVSFAALARPARADGAKYATVNVSKASIYQEPNEGAPVKQKVKKGTTLEVGGVKGMWVKVRTEGGVVGYVLKTDVVPGRRDVGGGAESAVSAGQGERVTHRDRGVGSGVTVENRLGLLTKAGLQFAGNSYGIKAGGGFSRNIPMKTAYTGINAEAEYFFIPSLGAHFRFADTFGSMSAELSAPVNKKVDKIPTNVTRIELDAMGRYFFGDSPAAPSLNGRLGFHIHQMLVDTVEKGGRPVFLVSQKYQGLVVGLGTDVPLGSPSFGVRAGADFWLAPSLSEGKSGASGKAKSASGLDFAAGTYFNFSDTSGMDIGFEYASFQGTFSGAGNRFNTAISGAKTTDSYILFGVNGTFRF